MTQRNVLADVLDDFVEGIESRGAEESKQVADGRDPCIVLAIIHIIRY